MKIFSFRSFLFTSVVLMIISVDANAQEGYTRPPMASNTIAAVAIGDMNLTSGDYIIMNSITETATICVEYSRNDFKITCEDENFMLKYEKEDNGYKLDKWEGVIKTGFLTVDLNNNTMISRVWYPDEIARGLALYRLIGTIQQMGADAILAPVVSMNMAKSGDLYYYKVTATGRPIKLRTN